MRIHGKRFVRNQPTKGPKPCSSTVYLKPRWQTHFWTVNRSSIKHKADQVSQINIILLNKTFPEIVGWLSLSRHRFSNNTDFKPSDRGGTWWCKLMREIWETACLFKWYQSWDYPQFVWIPEAGNLIGGQSSFFLILYFGDWQSGRKNV